MKNQLIIALTSLLTLGLYNPVLLAKDMSKMTELERLCYRFPKNSICKDKESYISLEKWKENKILCSWATKWENQEKKCKVIVEDRKLKIYVEQGLVYENLSKTLKTEIIEISLDEVFAFDSQWWIANVILRSTEAKLGGEHPTSSSKQESYEMSMGKFPSLEIGFIPTFNTSECRISKTSEYLTPEYLTISANNLHQIIEKMETWRYYFPDLTKCEEFLKFKPNYHQDNKKISENINRLKKINECVHCDLRNANLTKIELENANLQGANLQGANLQGANLKQAYLLGANLDRANLNKVNLEETNMMFASIVEANLTNAKLRGANLQNTNLEKANLTNAELNTKKFKVTNLKNAKLNNANLTNADIRCSNLQFASLKQANLTDANLGDCDFKSIGNSFLLSNLRLNDKEVPYNTTDELLNIVNLTIGLISIIKNPSPSTIIKLKVPTLVYYQESNLNGANFTGANLTRTNLSRANLTDANLSNTILDNTAFFASNLNNTIFINTNLEKISLNSTSFCEAIFSDDFIYDSLYITIKKRILVSRIRPRKYRYIIEKQKIDCNDINN